MPYTKLLSFCLALALLFVCCQKEATKTSTTVQPDSTTSIPPKLHMSLCYLLKQSTIIGDLRSNYELLISEPGGKILFDTVTNYNQINTADLQTAATFVDVSVIYPYNYAPGQAQYFACTYKGVNLASWKNIPLSDSVPGVYPIANGNATLALNNISAPLPFLWQFMSNDNNDTTHSPQGVSYSNDIVVTYPNEGDQYAYIAFPYDGVYKLHKIQGVNDSVDLSQLDTAITLSFNWSTEYDLNILLYGYMDSTNLSSRLLLAPGHGDYTHAYTYEAMYPSHNEFQKYDLLLTGNPAVFNPGAAVTEQATLRLTDLSSIPLNIPLLDESYYVVNSKTPDSFSISFPKVKPTYYTFSCSFGASNNFLLTVPGDSTVLDPEKALAIPLQSKFLHGDNPAMFVNGFTMAIDDEPDYQTYMTKEADVEAANVRPLSNQAMLNVNVNPQGGAFTTRFFKLQSISAKQ
ncbi:MAG TPA: hypothetical protein VL978_19055 [Puia sp.]|nr:hypothetical protein [Puia sp.]